MHYPNDVGLYLPTSPHECFRSEAPKFITVHNLETWSIWVSENCLDNLDKSLFEYSNKEDHLFFF